MAIQTDACPNFTGSAHDNSHLIFVPEQLHGAHLHPLRRLGSDLEKAPSPIKWGEYEDGLKPRDSRYGVCLTRSRLFVLDIDTHNGIDGNAKLAEICAKLGLDGLDTFTVATGTGGFHYYFQLPAALSEQEIKKSVNLWPGVDVFPQDQQVVGPGSKRTLEDGSIGLYEVSNDVEIAEMPAVLVKAIIKRIEKNEAKKKKARVTSSSVGAYSPLRVSNDLSEKQHAVLSSMCGELSGAQAGSRHATILRVAFNAGRFFGPEQEATVYPEIQAAAFASGHDENCGCVSDAFQRGMQEWQPFVPEFELKPKKSKSGEKSKKKAKKRPQLSADFFNEINVGRAYGEARAGEIVAVDEWNTWGKYASNRGLWEKTKSAVIDSDLLAWFADEIYPHAKKKQKSKATRFLNLPSCRNAARFVFGQVMESSDIFDARADLMLTQSGAVKLRDASQRRAEPADYFTKSGGTEYVPGYKSELWDEILSAFEPSCLPYLQVIIGQALTGYQPSDAAIHFFSGGGSNGKSTFLDVIMAIMGDYADAPDSSILMTGGADSFSKNVFKGLRMALLEETAESQWLDDKMVKKLAGTDKMRGAKKFQDEETFAVVTTVFITTNDLPLVSANDDGTWRRLKLFPMPYKFVAPEQYDAATSPANHRPRNPKLQRAKEEPEVLKAALAWAIEGARIWFENGEKELPAPEAMNAAQAEWRGRQDKIGSWWSEWLIEDPEAYCLVPDLYDTYKLSLVESGRKGAETKPKFLAALEAHELFARAGAEYVKQRRPSSDLSHSRYTPTSSNPYEPETKPRSARDARYFVTGIRFREITDLD